MKRGMRITLLAIAILVLCSARFKTTGRSAKKEVLQEKLVKSIDDGKVDMDDSWPFTNALRNTDSNLVELTRKVEVENNRSRVNLNSRA